MRLLLAIAMSVPFAALACPPLSDAILFHSCHAPSEARQLLLPEDAAKLADAGGAVSLTVTGGYTGRDRRAEDAPNPVGLFLRDGEVINPTLARMDGVLLIRDGGLELHHRRRVRLEGRAYDLTEPTRRRQFVDAAARLGVSVLQSHLLIVDGKPDVRPVEDAPVHVRRLLFTDGDGFGVYQTPSAVTLHDAAMALHRAHAPRMALNLDMGSFDYCIRKSGEGTRNCGLLGAGDTEKLSNLLRLSHR